MIFDIILIASHIFALTEGAGWQLVWSDEFNGTKISDAEWNYENGTAWNNELEYYTSHRPQNARLESGQLVIDVKVESLGEREFTSARLTSKKAWAYGKFEARAKLPKGKHLWPAIWLLPQNYTYGKGTASGEIDIMEYRGDRDSVVMGSLHFGGTQPYNAFRGSGEKDFGIDFSANYHTFGVEWDKNQIQWYVDGKVYHREDINRMMWSGKGPNPYTRNGQPFDIPFHWILNIAVSGTFFPSKTYGPPVTPAEARHWAKPTMELDYVRVYQHK